MAKLTGLSVRALHHYDDVGLLKPSLRSAANYRWYSEADALRLREIVLFRELGFSLHEVAELIGASQKQRVAALLAQRELLSLALRHQQAVLQVLDATLQTLRNETMNTMDEFSGLSQFQSGEYAEEARAQWGNSAAWQQAQQRKKSHGPTEWHAIQSDANAITQAFARSMQLGLAHDHPDVQALAERHREHLVRWFYDCPPAMHRCVTQLYTSDPRFQAHYDQHAPGLAAYIVAACHANADRMESA